MKDPEQPNTWQDIEQIVPAFEVQTTGTTGAGDCAIAGFIAAFLKGFPPKATLEFAAAVAAFCVEKPDAVSGVPSWDKVITRLQTDWPTLHSAV